MKASDVIYFDAFDEQHKCAACSGYKGVLGLESGSLRQQGSKGMRNHGNA